jgi:hypothetical protein
VAAVSFQVQLGFEGLVDRFDGLAQRLKQVGAGAPRPCVLEAAGARRPRRGGFEFGAEVVLVPDQGLAWPVGCQRGIGVQDLQQSLAFVGFRAG